MFFSIGWLCIKFHSCIKSCLRFFTAGWYVVTNGIIPDFWTEVRFRAEYLNMFVFVACKYIQTRKAGAKLSQETLQGFQNKKYGDQKE